jgi:hypothetical protein
VGEQRLVPGDLDPGGRVCPPGQHHQQVGGPPADGDVGRAVAPLPGQPGGAPADQPLAGRAQAAVGGAEVERLAVAGQRGQLGEVASGLIAIRDPVVLVMRKPL